MTGKRIRRKPGRHWLLLAALLAAGALAAAAGRSPARGSGGKSPAGGTAGDGTPCGAGDPGRCPGGRPEEMPWTPVQESEPVDDSYFDDVAFVGDSRPMGFRLYSGLERGTYFCVTGETVASATDMENWKTEDGRKISLADAVAAADCGKIYLMLGVNELGWNGTDIFRSHAENLLRRLQADHPDAEIVVQSLLPVSAEQDAKGSYVNNQRILAYNQVWMELAEETGCDYVNIAEAVTGEDGCLPAEMSFDGVHLNRRAAMHGWTISAPTAWDSRPANIRRRRKPSPDRIRATGAAIQ